MLAYVTIAFSPIALFLTAIFAQIALHNAYGTAGIVGRITEGLGLTCVVLSGVALVIVLKQFKHGPYRPAAGPDEPHIKPGTSFDAPPELKEAIYRMDDHVRDYTNADRLSLISCCLLMAIAILAPKATVGDPSMLTHWTGAMVVTCVMIICLSQMRMAINRPSQEEASAFNHLLNEVRQTGALVTPEPDARIFFSRGGRMGMQAYFMALLRALAHKRGLTIP